MKLPPEASREVLAGVEATLHRNVCNGKVRLTFQ